MPGPLLSAVYVILSAAKNGGLPPPGELRLCAAGGGCSRAAVSAAEDSPCGGNVGEADKRGEDEKLEEQRKPERFFGHRKVE